MSDDMNQLNTPSAPEEKKGFLSTPTGKIVAIISGLALLGIIAGVAVAIVLYVFGSQAIQEIEGQLENPPTTSGSGESTSTAEREAPAEEIPNAELFTFRDIFEPLIKPAAATTSSTTSSTTTTTPDTVTPTTAGTLYLDGVITEDGVLKAQLRYNGTSYTLASAGVIPNSPWQVLRVSSTNVVMLYGDVQVTLAVGQGITK